MIALLAIVVTSYRQTIYTYPSGGGSYIVAKDNLGELPGLTAAAALAVGYILTVSVSVASAVDQLIAAVPVLDWLRVWLGVGAIGLDQIDWFVHGRVVDISRLIQEFGFTPRTTAEAFDDFIQAHTDGATLTAYRSTT